VARRAIAAGDGSEVVTGEDADSGGAKAKASVVVVHGRDGAPGGGWLASVRVMSVLDRTADPA